MKVIRFFILIVLFTSFYLKSSAQTIDDLLDNTEQQTDSIPLSPADSARLADSVKIAELQEQVQQMKFNEIMLLEELEYSKKSAEISDSIKLVRRKERIDSLRAVTPGNPVIINQDTLFILYAKQGGIPISERANYISHTITRLGETRSVKPDSIKIQSAEDLTEVVYGETVILSISENDGLWMSMSRDSLATLYSEIIIEKVKEIQELHSIMQLVKRISYFVLIILIQLSLLALTAFLYRKLKNLIVRLASSKFKSISIKDYEFLNPSRQARILIFFANIIRYAFILVQLIFTIPALFSIFPQTEDLARQIFLYVIEPIKQISSSVVKFVPNVFYIIIIWLCIRYLIKGIQYLAKEIESERLKITGFYADWAMPSFNIIRFLLYAFMVAMIWPYLPGSGSQIFQGVSVFVGLIISLGSSTVIGNILAGMVITYMRPFRIGDRIKLNETIGNVIEKTPFVTRIKTPKNEIITIPNSFIMSNHTVNYSESARTHGLIIHTSITIGFEVDWRIVHRLLIEAARETKGVSHEPEPFVLDTGFGDYYPIYQINVFIKDADKMALIYARLHQKIQDKFKEAGIDIASPIMVVERENGEAMHENDLLERRKGNREHPENNKQQ